MYVKDMVNIEKQQIPVVYSHFTAEDILDINTEYSSLPVLDLKDNKLIGVVELKEVRRCRHRWQEIIRIDLVLFVDESAVILNQMFEKYNSNIIYVVNQSDELVGGIDASNRALPYLKEVSIKIPNAEIFDVMNDGIIIIDTNLAIVYANHSYSKLAGGLPIWKFLGRKVGNVEVTQQKRCVRVMKGELEPLINKKIYLKTLNLDVLATIKQIKSNGKVTGVICIFKDINETIKLSRKIELMEFENQFLKREVQLKSRLPSAFNEVVGRNKKFIECLEKASRVSSSNTNVMILGENGTGKEVIADAIHNASPRKDNLMVKVNCAAIPESLLESELFGYEAGAFTGANREGRVGKFELANKGTLFLDEVGDMTPAMQAKVLRAIQESKIERVGSNRTIEVDIRLIAATNKNLEQMVRDGTFREDLYYRLNVLNITLPSLRERKDDIPLLAEHFMDEMKKRLNKPDVCLTKEVMETLSEYEWKGNIRELRNVLEHALVMCTSTRIQLKDLPPYIVEQRNTEKSSKNKGDLKIFIKEKEKKEIIKALNKFNNNKSAAMRYLGISRRTFYKKLKEYQIISS